MMPSDERGFGITSDGKTADRGQVFKVEPTPKEFKQIGNAVALVSEQQFAELKADRDRLAERCRELLEALGLLSTLAGSVQVDVDHPLKMATEIERSVTQRLATAEADNAAMIKAIKFLFEPGPGIAVPEKYDKPYQVCEQTWNDKIDKLKACLSTDHPGTALAQRLAATQEALEEALTALPDSKHDEDETWEWCWNELSADGQEFVKEVREKSQQTLDEKEAPHG